MEDWLSEIDNRHDEAEADGKILWIGRDFEKAITECTFKLAKVGSMNLMMYIEREIFHQDRANEISYQRAIEMIKDLIMYISDNDYNSKKVIRELENIGIDIDDLGELGFTWMTEEE